MRRKSQETKKGKQTERSLEETRLNETDKRNQTTQTGGIKMFYFILYELLRNATNYIGTWPTPE